MGLNEESLPQSAMVSKLVFDAYTDAQINYGQFAPDVSPTTGTLVRRAAHDALVPSDEQLLEHARQFDEGEDISGEDDLLAIGEQAHAGSLLGNLALNREMHVNNGLSPEEADARAMLELRNRVARRIFRLSWLSQYSFDEVANNLWDSPEITQAESLTESIAQRVRIQMLTTASRDAISRPKTSLPRLLAA